MSSGTEEPLQATLRNLCRHTAREGDADPPYGDITVTPTTKSFAIPQQVPLVITYLLQNSEDTEETSEYFR